MEKIKFNSWEEVEAWLLSGEFVYGCTNWYSNTSWGCGEGCCGGNYDEYGESMIDRIKDSDRLDRLWAHEDE